MEGGKGESGRVGGEGGGRNEGGPGALDPLDRHVPGIDLWGLYSSMFLSDAHNQPPPTRSRFESESESESERERERDGGYWVLLAHKEK